MKAHKIRFKKGKKLKDHEAQLKKEM